jgi:RNA polymerase sigma-70 factor (ECF subfamily)
LQDIFVPIISEPPPADPPAALPALSSAVSKAIAQHYADSGAARFGISPEQFLRCVTAVVTKYAAGAPESEQLELLSKLQLQDLVLARACTSGNEAAWEVFLLRFRSALYETAYRIAKDEATGREIADELYADLYGIPNREGRRVSKLDYYMGRGSLEGWLRTVLSQHYVDRCRSHAKTVSLEEQLEAGASFPAPAEPSAAQPDPRLATALNQTLDELNAKDRFILASYFLDQCTLAQLARQLSVHESTMSRRLNRITTHLRKRTLKRLRAAGLSARQCEELLQEIDVRDLSPDLSSGLARKLRQETPTPAFYNKDGNKDESAQ